jgi:hypothetical protein
MHDGVGKLTFCTFIQNGFPPFYNKEYFRKIMEKYKDNEAVQKVMAELQRN